MPDIGNPLPVCDLYGKKKKKQRNRTQTELPKVTLLR